MHRLIKSLIHGKTDVRGVRQIGKSTQKSHYPYDAESVLQAGEHSSFTERRADEAVYDVLEWIKCVYLSDRVGDDFDGVISSVTKFGFFVELSGVYAEGLVHVSALLEDFYRYDMKSQSLVGERQRNSFALGDVVSVQVARVDIDERKVDLELLTHTPLRRKSTAGRGAKTNKERSRNRRPKHRKRQR